MLDKFRETAITWDKANRKVYEPLRVSAGDNKGRKLSVQIVNDGAIESLSSASLSLFWETKDKAHKGLDAFTAVDAVKGEFEIYYTTGMLSNEGVLNANLVLVDTSGRVVSEPFTITVFKGIDDDAIQSEDSFTALTEALAQVGNINNKADRAELLELESTFEQTKVSLEQQLAHKAGKSELQQISLSFKESYATLSALQTAYPSGNIYNHAVLSDGFIYTYKNGWISTGIKANGTGIADNSISYKQTQFLEHDKTVNLFDGQFSSRKILGNDGDYELADGTVGTNKTAIVPIKPNTTYTVLHDNADIFKMGTDTILNRENGVVLNGAIQWSTSQPMTIKKYTFTTGPDDKVLYIYASYTGANPLIQVVEGIRNSLTISDYSDAVIPANVSIYSKKQVDNLLSSSQNKMIVKKVGESFHIYIPTKENRYVYYVYKRVMSAGNATDNWRIQGLYITDSSRMVLYELSSDVEMEGAISEVGAADFIGGWHGDEYNLELSVLLDGVEIDKTAADFEKEATELKITNKSYLNQCDTTVRVFTRYKVNTWTIDGCVIENKVVADIVSNVFRSMMTMIRVPGAQINRVRTDYDYRIVDTTGGFESDDITESKKGIKSMEMWSTITGVYIRAVGEYDEVKYPNASQWVTSFVDGAKLYFDATGTVTLQPGDMIKTKSTYTIY